MKTLFICLLPLLILGTSQLSAQKNERYFRFRIASPAELDRLTRIISIANVEHDTVYAYANDREWETFQSFGYSAVVLPHPGSDEVLKMSSSVKGIMEWDSYPTYAGYLAMMQLYADSFPSICRLDTIGYSVQGRQLLALKISKNVDLDEDEPEFLYVAAQHGNEVVGYYVSLRLADYLLRTYGEASEEGLRVTRLLDSMEIWIHPLANPDGAYYLGFDTTVANAIRYNVNGVNLNRNFPDRLIDTNNTIDGREPEIQATMLWTLKRNITLACNLHGGAKVVAYPWSTGQPSGTYSACPDDPWFIHVSKTYATPNPDILYGGFPYGIVNANQWYTVYGCRDDWMYHWYGTREVCAEITARFVAPVVELPYRWANNKESLLAYMEEALKGIRGIVRDSMTGQPLRARIDVSGIDGVPVFTDPDVGDYYRMVLPGTHTLVFQAPGYYTDSITAINVTDSSAIRVNVNLVPLPAIPQLAAPADNAGDLTRNVEFRWHAAVGAGMYHFELARDPAFTQIISSQANIVDTVMTLAALDSCRRYYWRVRTVGPYETTDWSVVRTFRIGRAETYVCRVTSRWNIVSVPFENIDSRVSALFPTAQTNGLAFVPGSGFASHDSLVHGLGYWMKFDSSESVLMIGSPLERDSIDVVEGWNLIGSIFSPVDVHDITSFPGGMSTSNFWDYNGNYSSADTIVPGRGYWVKAEQPGKIILSTTPPAATMKRITIVNSTELPPHPPEGAAVYRSRGLPGEFGLEQNYPNPFNPTTIIEYQIPNDNHVTLKIYDVLGREVATLVDGMEEAGYKSVTWDAGDVPSGIYFCRFTAENYAFTRRLILLK